MIVEQKNALFEQMPVPKAYFKLSLPVVMSMVVSLVYSMVDTYFIAKTGNAQLVAGVALGSPVFTLMIAVGDIFGLGGSSFISRLFGQKRDEDGKRLSVFCFYGGLFSGVGIAALLLLLRTPLLTLLGAQPDTVQYAGEYYTWIALGAPFIILSFTPCNQLRTEGFANASMIGSVLGAVVNIILDPVLIFGCKLGAAGAAIATVIGYVFTDLYYIWFLRRRSRNLSVDIRLLKVSRQEVGQVFAIGIPASITNIAQSFCVLITNRFLVPYGTDKVAAMGIALKVSMIAVLILIGFAFGVQPLIGYNYGAQNYLRLQKALRFSYWFEIGLALVLTTVVYAGAPWLIRLFMQDSSVYALGVDMLRRLVMCTGFYAFTLVTTCVFQATGKAIGAFVLSISGQGVIYGLSILVLAGFWGYKGVIVTQPVADVLTCLLAMALYFPTLYQTIRKGVAEQKAQ